MQPGTGTNRDGITIAGNHKYIKIRTAELNSFGYRESPTMQAMEAIGKDGSNIDALISALIESRLKDVKNEYEEVAK